MKKQDVAGIIVYIIILALAAVFGLVVIRQYASKSNMDTGIFILFVAGGIIAGLLFNSILYELAHMFGAKVGGYNVTSVSVLGFTFVKENGKTKFRFSSFDGLTGETKIVPNTKRKKPANPIPYLIMGTVFYAIEVVASVFAFSILTREGAPVVQTNIGYFILIMMAVGAIIIFYNIIPFQLDSMTDGYRLRLVSGKKNKEAFNKMLLGETETPVDGETSDEEVKNSSFSSDLKLNQVLVCLDEEKYEEAEQLVDSIIEANKVDKKASNKSLFETKAHKIFLVILNRSFEEAEQYLNEHLSLRERKELSGESELVYMRAYILVAGLFDRSRSECVRVLDKVYKAYKRTPENRRKLESKLFNKALNIIIEKHPEWELNDYLISVEE